MEDMIGGKKSYNREKHDKEKTFCRLVSNEAIFAPQLTFSDKTASRLNHNGLFLYRLVVLFREKHELKTDWFNARVKNIFLKDRLVRGSSLGKASWIKVPKGGVTSPTWVRFPAKVLTDRNFLLLIYWKLEVAPFPELQSLSPFSL